MSDRIFRKRKCEGCGVEFTPTGSKQRYCGNREDKTGCSYKHVKEWHGKNWETIRDLKAAKVKAPQYFVACTILKEDDKGYTIRIDGTGFSNELRVSKDKVKRI